MTRLAIITTHPVQYNAPWFEFMARQCAFDLKVFYLWDFGVTEQVDAKFRRGVRWDIPLLSGYDHEFVPNISANPGTLRFFGLRNPSLSQRVQEYAPDAALLIGYRYASLLRFILRSRIPLILRGDSHRLVRNGGLSRRLKKRIISAIFRRFEACLYVGQANRQYFLDHGVSADRLFRSPHAVDNARFTGQADRAVQDAEAWREELAIPVDHRVVLFAGKFEHKKRPLDLLSAFVSAATPGSTLLFVGAGPLEGMLKKNASGHSNVRFAPFQNQTAMPRTYAAGDIFVLPSYGPSETWGLAINEAMCLSRPVIASTHVGCVPDLVHPYRNGLVFPAGDVPALSAALKAALSDPQRLQALGCESRRIIDGFTYETATEGLMEALEYVLERRAVKA